MAEFAQGCIAPDELQGFVAATLAPEARDLVESHLDECPVCRRVLVELVRSSTAPVIGGNGDVGSAGTVFALRTAAGSADETQPDRARRRGAAAAADDHEDLPVAGWDRYVVEAEHARGGLGRIMRGRDRRLRRRVALKEVLHDDRAATTRLVQEALITARLQHPSIVPIYDAGRWEDGTPFYCMKLVAGEPLSDRIERGGALDDRLALLPNVLAAAEAVAYAHDQRVIHRDIKPANILVGDYGETVVVDWGLAKDLAAAGADEPADEALDRPASASLTVKGSIMGTPAFMAPEQAMGEPVDERADVYALGVVLYNVLSGEHPGARDDRYAGTARSTGSALPAALEARQPGVPPDLLAIVRKATALDPDARYATAGELAEDLRRFTTGRLVAAYVYSRAEKLRRFVRRNRVTVLVAGVMLLALALTAGFSVRRIVAERDRADSERAQAVEQRTRAEGEERAATARADELTLLQARSHLDRDPTMAIAFLKTLSPSFSRWTAVRLTATAARERGLARLVVPMPGSIAQVVFSPDSSLIAVANRGDQVLRLVDSRTGGIRELRAGAAAALHDYFAFLPGDQTLLTAGEDTVVRAWDIRTARSRVFARVPSPVTSLTASADGRMVAAGCDGVVLLWDASGRGARTLRQPNPGPVSDVRFSSDGSLLAAVSRSGEAARLWRLPSGEPIDLRSMGSSITWIEFSRDGRYLASGAAVGPSLSLFDVATGKERRLSVPGAVLDPIVASGTRMLHFSPDGQRLAAAHDDGSVRVWAVSGGEPINLPAFRQWAVSVRFLADSQRIVACGEDASCVVWDADARLRQKQLRGHTGVLRAWDPSPDGRSIATGSDDGTVRVWQLPDDPRSAWAPGRYGQAMSFSPDSTRLAIGDRERGVRLWDIATGTTRALGAPGAAAPEFVRFSPDGRHIASSEGSAVRLWRVDGGAARVLAERGGHPIVALTFSPDGGTLAAAANAAPAIALWGVASGTRRELRSATYVYSVEFSPDGSKLAYAGEPELQLWDLAAGQARLLPGNLQRNLDLAYAPDGRTLAAAGMDHKIRVWDVATGRSTVLGDSGVVFHLAFSPDGGELVVSSERGLQLWDVPTRDHVLLVDSARRAPKGEFSPDGRWLAIGESNGAVHLSARDVPRDGARLRRWLAALTNAVPR